MDAIENATVEPNQNKLDVVVNAWNENDRTVTIQPVGRTERPDRRQRQQDHRLDASLEAQP